MAIKMGHQRKENARCIVCGYTISASKEMYKFMFENNKNPEVNKAFNLCDEHANELMTKILKAQCEFNSRVKSQEELRKFNSISARRQRRNDVV